MKSMTGFGCGTATADNLTCTVEIKSVNARYLDLFIRSPKQINPFENLIREQIQQHVARGKVEISVSIQDAGGTDKNFHHQSCAARANSGDVGGAGILYNH
nr:YicC/YloC family endoribonuclease [Veillonella denticariosi]